MRTLLSLLACSVLIASCDPQVEAPKPLENAPVLARTVIIDSTGAITRLTNYNIQGLIESDTIYSNS